MSARAYARQRGRNLVRVKVCGWFYPSSSAREYDSFLQALSILSSFVDSIRTSR